MTTFARTARHASIAMTIIGGIVLAALLVGAAVPTANSYGGWSAGSGSGSDRLDVAGAERLVVDSGVSDFTVEFGDVNRAELKVQSSRDQAWSMRMSNGTIEVTNTKGIGNFCFGWCPTDDALVRLTLPRSLDDGSLDVDLSVSAGALSASGEFSNLDLEVGAGMLVFTGSADAITAQISAGEARIDAADVDTIDLQVAAGQAIVALSGQAPRDVTVNISAGKGDLTLPDVPYALTSQVSLGSLDNRLTTQPGSTHRIDVEVEVGSLSLRPRG